MLSMRAYSGSYCPGGQQLELYEGLYSIISYDISLLFAIVADIANVIKSVGIFIYLLLFFINFICYYLLYLIYLYLINL